MTIIFLARKLPDAISDELSRQGHFVFECLAISEVYALAEEHMGAQIVIAVGDGREMGDRNPAALSDITPETWCYRERHFCGS